MSEAIHHLKVMAPVELGVSAAILDHRYGKVARLIFDYLLVQTKMQHALDSEGFVSVSQSRLRSLGIDTSSRRRGPGTGRTGSGRATPDGPRRL